MILRLTFVPESEKDAFGVEGADATEILEEWRAIPFWAVFDPANFRQRIVDFHGAEQFIPGGMPAADEEILDAVVKAAGPDTLKLEQGPASAAMMIRQSNPRFPRR